jgi:hypothetical protein
MRSNGHQPVAGPHTDGPPKKTLAPFDVTLTVSAPL